MKNEKILKAIGSLSDELIEDANLEKLRTTETRKYLYPRKIFRFGLAAVLIVGLLGGTALAVQHFRSYQPFQGYEPQIGNPMEVVTPTRDGVSQSGQLHHLSFHLPLNEDAPELIERYYFPDVPEIYEHSSGYAYAGRDSDRLTTLDFFWDTPEGEKKGIRFRQESVGGLEGNVIRTNVFTPTGTKPELTETVLGGAEGVLIKEHEQSSMFPTQYFYWSDGNYAFEMWFPLDFTEEQMGEMIASVKEVEDIRPYLISMEAKDIKETFG